MYDDLIYIELKKLNGFMEKIARSLGSIAAEGNTCDTCTEFYKGSCNSHDRNDGPYAPCVDDARACPDYAQGPNSTEYPRNYDQEEGK